MKSKSEFVCLECGNITSKWFGKCQNCGNWNCIEEREVETTPAFAKKSGLSSVSRLHEKQVSSPINTISYDDNKRIKCNICEFDRVLGGGLVEGSVILLSGEPGVGKSTLLLQVCARLSDTKNLLYVTGEESPSQIKLRAKRNIYKNSSSS